MILQPASAAALRAALADANARGERIEAVDLAALNRIVAHTPEDMTVTVEAGLTLGALQQQLATHGQWLPIDPPGAAQLTIGALLAKDLSGPRRLGCGVVRDHLIGIRVALADGRLIKSGGQVVKNVAGYDLLKLFVGSRGSLGVIVEATFKLRPLPEAEQFISTQCASLDEAAALLETIWNSPLTPHVLDLHRLSTLNSQLSTYLVVGFAGAREDVEWQCRLAADVGLREPASLAYDEDFRAVEPPPHKLSVPPARVIEVLRPLDGAPFVARAGTGVIYHRGAAPAYVAPDAKIAELARRLKDAFDPKHILPDPPA